MAWARYKDPLLVLDMRNSPTMPRHYRTTSDSVPQNVNTMGLAELHIVGSGQFSRSSLQKVLRELKVKQITIVDLRQESHGMLDGNAVSWYGPRNAANADNAPAEIIDKQSRLLAELGDENIAVVNKILKKTANGEIASVKPVEYMVHQTATEEALAKEMKLHYARIFVQDYHAPTPEQVDRFIALIKKMPANQWVYLHCRAGIGRTTVFMTMYDMMRNAKTVSLQDILARQKALGGKDLTLLPAKSHFKYPLAVDRLNFIKRFYEYAKSNQDHFKTTWSQWLKKSGNS